MGSVRTDPVVKDCVDHDCLDHLLYREHEWVETHGLDCGPYEHCWQEWWECAICGENETRECEKK